MSANIYYVYQYVRSDGTPYYIGKGKNRRAWTQNGHSVYLPPDKDRIQIIRDNLSESEAHEVEKDLIQKYGRKDLGTGILRNLTDGGDGASGRIYKPSKETNKKVSAALKGKPTWNKGKKGCSGQVAWNKGIHNPLAANNGKKGAKKQAQTVTGRKKFIKEDGSWTWVYPNKK